MSIEDQYLIWIDPDYLADNKASGQIMPPESYKNEVRDVIVRLARSKVGYALLHTIQLWRKGVRIAPPQTFGVDICGAEISDSVQGELKDRDYNKNIYPSAKLVDKNAVPFRAVVHFIPRLDMKNATCHAYFTDPKKADYLPTVDEVLVHELTHAIRYLSQTFDAAQPDIKVGSGSMSHVESGEEFMAVLVEDMYQSEQHASIRFSHDKFHTLDVSMQDSFTYFRISRKAFGAVERFCQSSPFFSDRLGKVRVAFNPIAAFYKDPKKCREMSEASTVM